MNLSIKYRLLLLLLSMSIWTSMPLSANVIRAAIDVGASGPKLRVAEVDMATAKINKIIHIEQYPVLFQEKLSRSSDKMLTPEIMVQGIKALKDAILLAQSLGAEGVVIIGASVFRNAVNGDLFARCIESETGLRVHLLDQDLEGKLAFQAAHAKMDIESRDLVVWDIGGGSTQFIAGAVDGSHFIDGSNEGSGPFRDFIIESIQHRNLKECRSPNPLSSEQAALAELQASLLSEKVGQIFKDKIREPNTKIAGVGSVFGRGIATIMDGKNPFTIEDLNAAIHELIGKTDTELGGGDFACIEVSNALLVLGFMKGLNIKQMNTIDINNADGAMVYEPFWEDGF